MTERMIVARRCDMMPPPGSSARFLLDPGVDHPDLPARRDGGARPVAAAAGQRHVLELYVARAVLAQQPLLEAGLP